ncbi:hypothetical protein BE221DRAFT_55478, partial [Ostreococcus tauri]
MTNKQSSPSLARRPRAAPAASASRVRAARTTRTSSSTYVVRHTLVTSPSPHTFFPNTNRSNTLISTLSNVANHSASSSKTSHRARNSHRNQFSGGTLRTFEYRRLNTPRRPFDGAGALVYATRHTPSLVRSTVAHSLASMNV